MDQASQAARQVGASRQSQQREAHAMGLLAQLRLVRRDQREHVPRQVASVDTSTPRENRDRTIKIVSLFSGIGGLDLGFEWAFDGQACVVAQVEKDPFCRSILAHWWPTTLRFSDVCKVGVHNLPKHDMLIGGFPCFPAGTLITTSAGLKPIETIAAGEQVLTHCNRYKRVLTTMHREGAPLVEVRAMGALPIQVTPEHPFWARRVVRKKRRGGPYRQWDPPRWVEAKDLTKDDYVAQPVKGPRCRREWESNAFWYLVGRWLGDGWIVNYKRTSKIPQGRRGSRCNSRIWKAIICCAHKEADELAEHIRAAGFHATRAPDRTTTKFHISSKKLVEFLQPFGRGAGHKVVPQFLFGAPNRVLTALWNGYMGADGSTLPTGAVTATSISKQLAVGMARVGRCALQRPVAVYGHTPSGTGKIEGREVKQRTQYVIRASKHWQQGFVEGAHAWVPVRSVTSLKGTSSVFNLEVEGDNSYVADSVVVHNCQDVSSAGKRAGLSGAQSGLWFQFARVIEECHPEWVVIENVASGAGRWVTPVRCRLDELGYESLPIPLSARDCGAPHFRRRVFIIAKRTVADTNGKPIRQHQQRVPRGRPGAVRDPRQTEFGFASQAVADTHDLGQQTQPTPRVHGQGQFRNDPARCRADLRWEWPPGPEDFEGWKSYLAGGGPQPAVLRGPTRDARRVHSCRLHAIGNAVSPQQAAVIAAMVRQLMEVVR